MKTSKPFSTISYNTDDFLVRKLNELVAEFKVEFWCFVRHLGELDDSGNREKDHKHVYIVPNGRVDTMELNQFFLEPDLSNIGKPLRCMDFRSAKEDDWILYASHDPDYLKTKFLVREFSYQLKDFVCSDSDEFKIKWDRAFHESEYMKNQRMLSLLENHTASQLASSGFVAPQQAFAMQCFYRMVKQGRIEDWEQKTDSYYEPCDTPFGKAYGFIKDTDLG